MSTTPDKKDWHMYTSRKSVKPQNSNWPAVCFENKYFCFAHLKRVGGCKKCSFDICKYHKDMQDRCLICTTKHHGVNTPCKKHLSLIAACKDCSNRKSFTSMKDWVLCHAHQKFRRASKHSRLHHYKQVQEKIVRCFLCHNRNESERFRQKRNDSLMKLYRSTDCRPSQSVNQDASEAYRNNNLDDDVAESEEGSNDVN